ncbi:MAG: alpha/beta hydrolase [Myxococcales bacterium]|nr:alpha/beta hydrolase [Myxococcales bacterium]
MPFLWLLPFLSFALVTACSSYAELPLPGRDQVQVVRDLSYLPDNAFRHRLDLYLPAAGKDWPVAVVVHGGAFVVNDKHIVDNLGYALADAGIAAVCINYRLFPGARHPALVEDVAAGLSWARRETRAYGADPDRRFLIGYSAGAYLAALAITDPRYLAARGDKPGDLLGAVLMSGAYDAAVIRQPLRLVFTNRVATWREASPIRHVTADLPPTLILYAEHDLRWFIPVAAQSRLFYDALKNAGVEVQIAEIPHCGHNGIEQQIGRLPASPSWNRLLGFINERLRSRVK